MDFLEFQRVGIGGGGRSPFSFSQFSAEPLGATLGWESSLWGLFLASQGALVVLKPSCLCSSSNLKKQPVTVVFQISVVYLYPSPGGLGKM